MVAGLRTQELKTDLKQIVEFGLCDNMRGRIVDGTGRNTPVGKEIKAPFRSLRRNYINTIKIKKMTGGKVQSGSDRT